MDTGEGHISILNEQSSYSLDEKKLKQIGGVLLRALGLSAYELSMRFVDSAEITRLNKEYRQKNRSTDVLSFPQMEFVAPVTVMEPVRGPEWEVPEPLGDLVISLQDAEHNARHIGQSLSKETAFLVVHGILHLAGHDHMQPEEEQRMLEQQRVLMSQLEQVDPPLWHDCVAELN